MLPNSWHPTLGLSPETVDYVQAVIGLKLEEANDGLQDTELALPGLMPSDVDALALAHARLWDPLHHSGPLAEIAEQAAALRAVSYRGFKVGAGAILAAVYPGQRTRIGIFTGANNTPYKGAPKRCAEMEIVTKAEQAGFNRLIAISVFGPSEFEGINEIESPTLHPCQPCRTLFESSVIVDETSTITTVNAQARESMTFRELMILHGQQRPAASA
jgi:cytidine deaminase